MADRREGGPRTSSVPTIVVIGALDTKGAEIAFLKEQIEERGKNVLVVDSGVLGEPAFAADITRAEVAEAGGAKLPDLIAEATEATRSRS